MKCQALVHEDVCVQAEVKITPEVRVGEISTHCVGCPCIGVCAGVPCKCCSFVVSQNICVEVPLAFKADVDVFPCGIVCGTPGLGGCQIPCDGYGKE